MTIERYEREALTEEVFEECLALEQKGWKGRQGSAVLQSDAVHGFHLDLFRSPWFRERLSLFVMRLSGKPIAFHYGHTTNGVFSLVITSFDELYSEFSPGHLLTQSVLGHCISRKLREFDFLGCDLPWKLEWTPLVRPHFWIFIFRDSFKGRLLKKLKFDWAEAARLLLTKGP